MFYLLNITKAPIVLLNTLVRDKICIFMKKHCFMWTGVIKKNMLFIKYTYFLFTFLMMVVLAGVMGIIHNEMTRIDKSKSLTCHVMHMRSSLRYEFTLIEKSDNMSAGEV